MRTFVTAHMEGGSYQKALKSAVEKIISSESPRKLVVSGPGTGKTTLFQKVLRSLQANEKECLALTFINNLKEQLSTDLKGLAKVFTLHGYCHYLLRKNSKLRKGLDEEFLYYPGLVKVIKLDWELARKSPAPQFIRVFRDLEDMPDVADFYLKKANYYNAVGYDDSIYRIYKLFDQDASLITSYKLIVVDEYQDFNLLETSLLDKLIQKSPVLVVGDDDQALYQHLRNSNPHYIRRLVGDENYERFPLPFCLRCTEVVLGAFDDVVKKAGSEGLLRERVEKDLLFFPPAKQVDSNTYPKINEVHTTIQRLDGGNYIGKFILKEIKERVRPEEICESREKGFPTVLIIGPKHYTGQIKKFFDDVGFEYKTRPSNDSLNIKLLHGLKFLKKDEDSNLGWRIVLKFEEDISTQKILKSSMEDGTKLSEVLSKEYKNAILQDLDEKIKKLEEEEETTSIIDDKTKPSIVLTSFEGAKGLQACHVFITGLQNGDLPKDPHSISDIEISKFVVALTRTIKQCYLIYTTNFGGQSKEKSVFIDWIDRSRRNYTRVDKHFWNG